MIRMKVGKWLLSFEYAPSAKERKYNFEQTMNQPKKTLLLFAYNDWHFPI